MESGLKTTAANNFERFNQIVRMMADYRASDLHISVSGGFRYRIDGRLVPAPQSGPLLPGDTAGMAAGILLSGRKCTKGNVAGFIDGLTDCDCSYSLPGHGRYRVNIASQRRTLSLVLRHIPAVLPTIEGLDLPPVLSQIALAERGLVLVTGITGSGKSTTLAAMINLINRTKQAKIVTSRIRSSSSTTTTCARSPSASADPTPRASPRL